jgi:hypothetical protein
MQIGISLGLARLGGDALTQQALSILRAYGTDAHLWLPGVGAINGITAGNFSDTAGTTAAIVDSTAGVGLVVDSTHTVGAELLTNQVWVTPAGSDNVTSGTGPLVSSTGGTTASSRSAVAISGVASGRTYAVSFRLAESAGATSFQFFVRDAATPGVGTILFSSAALFITTGVVTVYFTAISANCNLLAVSNGGGSTFTVDNISVRELVGAINATQGTTANKPILRQTSGRFSWQFDGTDFLTLGAVPFQMADDHCVVAAASPASLPATGMVFSVGNAGSPFQEVCGVFVANTNPNLRVRWRDNANTTLTLNGPATLTLNQTFVVSAARRSNARLLRFNGAQSAIDTTASLGATTLTGSAIGQYGAGGSLFTGNIGPVIAIRGTVSDANLLTLERWVGSLSGVSIP